AKQVAVDAPISGPESTARPISTGVCPRDVSRGESSDFHPLLDAVGDDTRRPVAPGIRRPSSAVVLGLLGGILVVFLILGSTFGSVAISPLALGQMTLNHLGFSR